MRAVFDLGANNGDDTAAYLSMGYDVVAVEANPELCAGMTERFATDITDGYLTVVNAALSDQTGQTTFHINTDNDHWSSTDIRWAGRENGPLQTVIVKAVTLSDLYNEHGTPHYLKIDIEGAEQDVLDQLRYLDKPAYLSVEDCRHGAAYIDMLDGYGYRAFKLSDQTLWPKGTSGPFGENLPGEWLSYYQMIKLYHEVVRSPTGERIAEYPRYFDIHVRLG